MKYVILACLFMFGCSTVSEYNKGCRDGVTEFTKTSSPKEVDTFCDDLDVTHKAEQKVQSTTRH